MNSGPVPTWKNDRQEPSSHESKKESYSIGPSRVSAPLYRCVCGCEFKFDVSKGGKCPHCQREYKAEAIRQAMMATVTVGDITNATSLLWPDGSEDDPLIGSVLGHFKLDSPIGRGGMGVVYRALDTSLQRYVAVKVVRNQNATGKESEDQVATMLQEAVAQARLNHPNVVTIYYVGRQEDQPFLAMELVSGPTLSDRLKVGPLPYASVISIGLQVVDALRHANQFGIIHADIKPSNLLISGEQQIKLSDFGLSRLIAGDAANSKVAGTPSYLAPELLDGKGFSIQSDMYALGVTLFELTFGRTPFELQGTTIREQLQTHQTAVVQYPQPWPTTIPQEFKMLLNRLLAKAPEDRFLDYDDLHTELRKLLPVNATTAGLAPRATAYAIDQIMLLGAFAPFVVAMIALNQVESLHSYALLIPLIAILAFVVPAIYLAAIRSGWRSLGCYLFQLRTVDEHGLPLRKDLRFTREIMRCMASWLIPIATFAGLYHDSVDNVIDFAVILSWRPTLFSSF